MFRFLVLLSLIPCHLAVFALTLPVLTNVTAVSKPPNVPTNAEAHCPPQGPQQSDLPFSPDCVRAVRALPQTHYVGTFHIGRDESLWRLPTSRSFGSCKALVSLNVDFDRELGSWEDVQSAAIQLLLWCRLPFEPGGEQRTGGWTTSGEEDGVVVELSKTRYGAEDRTGVGMEMNLVDVE